MVLRVALYDQLNTMFVVCLSSFLVYHHPRLLDPTVPCPLLLFLLLYGLPWLLASLLLALLLAVDVELGPAIPPDLLFALSPFSIPFTPSTSLTPTSLISTSLPPTSSSFPLPLPFALALALALPVPGSFFTLTSPAHHSFPTLSRAKSSSVGVVLSSHSTGSSSLSIPQRIRS